MRKMCYIVLASLALLIVGALAIGCQSCHRANNAPSGIKNTKGVPAVIADAKLLSYKYTLQGTARWPLHSERVDLCADDSTRCIIRLFDDARLSPDNFDLNGDPLPDSLIAHSEVLDTIKQMIIDAKAWLFKDNYSPRASTIDGNSWSFSASFSVTDSVLASTPEARRPRLLRNGGITISSGGANASPDTRLFEQVRLYLLSIFQDAGLQQSAITLEDSLSIPSAKTKEIINP